MKFILVYISFLKQSNYEQSNQFKTNELRCFQDGIANTDPAITENKFASMVVSLYTFCRRFYQAD